MKVDPLMVTNLILTYQPHTHTHTHTHTRTHTHTHTHTHHNTHITHTHTQHTDKTLYNLDGSVNASDSFILIFPFDYLGLAPVIEVAPMFREATLYPCEGIYCSEPAYIPVKHMAK